MKKFTYIFAALLGVLAFSSCVKEVGSQPGNDSKPSVIVYQYKPGAEYNPDNDVAVRFASNNKVAKAYYLVESKDTKDGYIKKNGEEAYAKYIVEKGVALKLNGASAEDVVLAGLAGTNAISAVGVDANGATGKVSAVEFTGLSWSDVCVGEYLSSGYKKISGLPESFETTLQKCDQVDTKYRFTPFFKESALAFDLIGDPQTDKAGDTFYNFTVAPQNIGYSYGSYGAIFVSDVSTWQASSSYATYNIFYPADGWFDCWMAYRVSAGCIAYDDDYFEAY